MRETTAIYQAPSKLVDFKLVSDLRLFFYLYRCIVRYIEYSPIGEKALTEGIRLSQLAGEILAYHRPVLTKFPVEQENR